MANLRQKPAGIAPAASAFDRSNCFRPGTTADVGVVRTGGEYCLVATHLIPAGQKIFTIEGDLTQLPSRYSVQIGYQLHMDLNGEHSSEEILDRYFWRFMNHSCEPSAVVRERDVIAARDIQPWEPVTFDYTTTEWEMAEPFACNCRSRHCLAQVQGFRFLTAEQRTRLGPVAAHLGRYLTEASRW
ncbi:MAG: SET domain-containing protein [Pseudomonadota bacterium]